MEVFKQTLNKNDVQNYKAKYTQNIYFHYRAKEINQPVCTSGSCMEKIMICLSAHKQMK